MLRAPKPKLPPLWVAALLINGGKSQRSASPPSQPIQKDVQNGSESLGPNPCLQAVEPFGTKDAEVEEMWHPRSDDELCCHLSGCGPDIPMNGFRKRSFEADDNKRTCSCSRDPRARIEGCTTFPGEVLDARDDGREGLVVVVVAGAHEHKAALERLEHCRPR